MEGRQLKKKGDVLSIVILKGMVELNREGYGEWDRKIGERVLSEGEMGGWKNLKKKTRGSSVFSFPFFFCLITRRASVVAHIFFCVSIYGGKGFWNKGDSRIFLLLFF